MSRIVFASHDADFEARIREAFENRLNGQLRRWEHDMTGVDRDVDAMVADLTNDGPDIVTFGSDVDVETALRLTRAIDRDHPEVEVLLVTKPSSKLWERALKAGVKAVIPPDAEVDQVREEFERALEAADRRRVNLTSDDDLAGRSHRVLVVTAAKGGAGKSVMASNLAVGLAQAAPENVVLVDLDLQFGDVAGALQLAPEHTIADVVGIEPLDLTGLKVFLTPHPSGLYALCAPPTPPEADDISPEMAARIIKLLSEEFRYVVVDTSAGMTEHTVAAFDVATDFVLVGNMDVPSVRALRKEVDVLDQLGHSRQARHFILNRADSRVGLSQPDVEATVGLKVGAAIPSSRSVPMSFNQGTPIVASDPRSPVTRALMDFVGTFAAVPIQTESGGFSLPWRR